MPKRQGKPDLIRRAASAVEESKELIDRAAENAQQVLQLREEYDRQHQKKFRAAARAARV